jgi:hypothetical protein
MKTNDAWKELKETIQSWSDLYGGMKTVECAQKKWLCESVIKLMNGLEEKYE